MSVEHACVQLLKSISFIVIATLTSADSQEQNVSLKGRMEGTNCEPVGPQRDGEERTGAACSAGRRANVTCMFGFS